MEMILTNQEVIYLVKSSFFLYEGIL